MRKSLLKTLRALHSSKEPLTPQQVQAITGVSKSSTALCLIELYDNLLASREHRGGRAGFEFQLLSRGYQLLKIAERENK